MEEIDRLRKRYARRKSWAIALWIFGSVHMILGILGNVAFIINARDVLCDKPSIIDELMQITDGKLDIIALAVMVSVLLFANGIKLIEDGFSVWFSRQTKLLLCLDERIRKLEQPTD